MFTPQEVQERTFVKAVFGGYDMSSVDNFLEPLTEDYITLYKENAVLKSKMKILVEKLEEYHGQEDSMKKALVLAQNAADHMISETEKKCAQMTTEAESTLRARSTEAEKEIHAEEDRIERAKQAALNFIDVIEKDVHRHLDLLDNLKLMNLTGSSSPAPAPAAPAEPKKPQVYDIEKDNVPPAPTPEEQKELEQQEIAAEIEQNLEKVIGTDDDGDLDKTRVAPGAHARFADLQFGKNYDPNRK